METATSSAVFITLSMEPELSMTKTRLKAAAHLGTAGGGAGGVGGTAGGVGGNGGGVEGAIKSKGVDE